MSLGHKENELLAAAERYAGRLRDPSEDHMDMPGSSGPPLDVPDPVERTPPLSVFLPNPFNQSLPVFQCFFHIRRSVFYPVGQRHEVILRSHVLDHAALAPPRFVCSVDPLHVLFCWFSSLFQFYGILENLFLWKFWI